MSDTNADTTPPRRPPTTAEIADTATAETTVTVIWTVQASTTYRTTIALGHLLDAAAPDDMAEVEHLLCSGADLSEALAAVALDDTALPSMEGDGAHELQYPCTSRDLIAVEPAKS